MATKQKEAEEVENESAEKQKELEKVVKNPHHFGDSFGEVAETLNKLDAQESDYIRAGKHPYFWMTRESILDKKRMVED